MGLASGHVHVIDDESSFPDSFGRSVLIGLLQLPAEDMHRSAKQESVAAQVCPSQPPLHGRKFDQALIQGINSTAANTVVPAS